MSQVTRVIFYRHQNNAMKILITGASGQLGLSFVKKLRQTSWEFFSFTHEQLNIADKYAVESVVNEYKPDVIINTLHLLPLILLNAR